MPEPTWEIVNAEISKFYADNEGLRDFALESAGTAILQNSDT